MDEIPENIELKKGDLIRMVIRENPTTGYWWHSNAARSQDAPIRQVYSGFEAPDMTLIGASGKRILVFEINDLNAKLKLGLSRPNEFGDEFDWEKSDEKLDDHLFSKRISFIGLNEDTLSIIN